jgi:hypothetical protein
MAFLDFIKNRNQTVSAPANEQGGPGPETAKQSYTREAAQEKLAATPVTSMRPEDLAEARALGSKIQPTTPPGPTTPSPVSSSPADAPTGTTDNQQPMKQVAMGQDKTAPDLSPSSAQAGVKEAELPVRPDNTPSPNQPSPKPSRSMSPDL